MKKIFLLSGFLFLFFPCVFAQDLGGNENDAPQIPPTLNGGILPGPTNEEVNRVGGRGGVHFVQEKFFPGVINSFLVMVLALSVGMFVISGYFFFFSGTNSQMKDKAKNTLIWTILGVVIVILSLAIVQVVTGINFSS